MSHSDVLIVGPDVEDTDEHQDSAHASHAPDVDGATAKVRHESEPVDQASNKGKGSAAESKRVGSAGAKTDLGEEVGAVVREADTAKNLTGEAEAGNLSATKLNALEAVEVRGADGQLLLEVVGVDDGGESVLDIDVSGLLRLEAVEGSLSVFHTVHADEVPGRLRREVDERDKEAGPDPLQSEGNLVAPLILAGRKSLENASADELSQNEAHIREACHVCAKTGGKNLRCVGRCGGRKDAPGKTAADLANDQNRKAGCKENNEDSKRQGNEGTHDGLAGAVLGDQNTSEEAADDGTSSATLGETSLPFCSQLVASGRLRGFANPIAILDKERRVGEEVTEQVRVVAFHDDAHLEDKSPENSGLVNLQRLSDGEVVLGIGGVGDGLLEGLAASSDSGSEAIGLNVGDGVVFLLVHGSHCC